ncbi:MAG TPA: TonB-dependent receptor plug domain-containing protein, partial [Candidatus Binatia bacterium]|nr:TonB-dependent receptor plug domain-containing protein [Candidatus Binatia bacterium]
MALAARKVFARLCLLGMIACWPHRSSLADDPAAAPPAATPPPASLPQLPPTVVTATRTRMPESEVPASVTVLTQDDISRSSALAVDDLLRQIPGFNTFRRSSSLVTAPAQDP